MTHSSLSSLPLGGGDSIVLENCGRVNGAATQLASVSLNNNSGRFLKSGRMGEAVAILNGNDGGQPLTQQNLFCLHFCQQKFEMIPIPSLGKKAVPCARVYITNARGDHAVTATDIEGHHGSSTIDMQPLDRDFDTPMAQWWLIPAEAAFPSEAAHLVGVFIIRSFAGNGMFLGNSGNFPFLSRNAATVDLWRISPAADRNKNNSAGSGGGGVVGGNRRVLFSNPAADPNWEGAASPFRNREDNGLAASPSRNPLVSLSASPQRSNTTSHFSPATTGNATRGTAPNPNPLMMYSAAADKNTNHFNTPNSFSPFRQQLDSNGILNLNRINGTAAAPQNEIVILKDNEPSNSNNDHYSPAVSQYFSNSILGSDVTPPRPLSVYRNRAGALPTVGNPQVNGDGGGELGIDTASPSRNPLVSASPYRNNATRHNGFVADGSSSVPTFQEIDPVLEKGIISNSNNNKNNGGTSHLSPAAAAAAGSQYLSQSIMSSDVTPPRPLPTAGQQGMNGYGSGLGLAANPSRNPPPVSAPSPHRNNTATSNLLFFEEIDLVLEEGATRNNNGSATHHYSPAAQFFNSHNSHSSPPPVAVGQHTNGGGGGLVSPYRNPLASSASPNRNLSYSYSYDPFSDGSGLGSSIDSDASLDSVFHDDTDFQGGENNEHYHTSTIGSGGGGMWRHHGGGGIGTEFYSPPGNNTWATETDQDPLHDSAAGHLLHSSARSPYRPDRDIGATQQDHFFNKRDYIYASMFRQLQPHQSQRSPGEIPGRGQQGDPDMNSTSGTEQYQQDGGRMAPTRLLRNQALASAPFWGLQLDQGNTEIDYVWVDGPAYKAGIRPLDVIVAINQQPTPSYEHVIGEIRQTRVAEGVTVTVARRGKPLDFRLIPMTVNPNFAGFPDIYYDRSKHKTIPSQMQIDMAAAEKEAKMTKPAGKPGSEALRNQALKAPPFWGLSMDSGDTEIDYIWVDSPAHKAGILPQDKIVAVNGLAVDSYLDVIRALKAGRINEPMQIVCVRKGEGKPRAFTVKPMTANPTFRSFRDLFYDRKKHYKIPRTAEEQAEWDARKTKMSKERKKELMARARLTRYYQVFRPHLANKRTVNATMAKFPTKDKQDKMWKRLINKYGEEPKAEPRRKMITDYKPRLTAYYQKYKPEYLPQVDEHLEKNKGREKAMFKYLVKKYGPEPNRQ